MRITQIIYQGGKILMEDKAKYKYILDYDIYLFKLLSWEISGGHKMGIYTKKNASYTIFVI